MNNYTNIIGKETEDKFMALTAGIGWEPVWFKNPSGKFDILILVNNNWYKIQVKTACMDHKSVVSYLFHNCSQKKVGSKYVRVDYKREDVDFFAVLVDTDFYFLPFHVVYRKTGRHKKRINIEKDSKYKLSNILKSCKNGKYFVDDTIILG
jgi:hypothetical protein